MKTRGSILVVVLVSIVFATAALLLFVRKASTDLLVEVREADAQRLRLEGYAAMETTLAVLDVFRQASDGLRSPRQGWGNPFEWSDYRPGDGREVTVTFADESGRISLPRANFTVLSNLFQQWEVAEPEAERWADALLGWMKEDYVPRSITGAQVEDYARAPLPFKPPGRPLRTWEELRAIDVIREAFFDEDGRPNVYAERFKAAVSLLDYRQINVNAASPDALAAAASYDENQLRQLGDYLAGTGAYAGGSRGYFDSADEVRTVLGDQAETAGLGALIQALRVAVTVRQGQATFVLSAVVAPPGGARVVPPMEVPPPEGASTPPAGPAGGAGASTDETRAALNYPFTILEITENDVGSGRDASVPDEPPYL